jgi:hypothetical protein
VTFAASRPVRVTAPLAKSTCPLAGAGRLRVAVPRAGLVSVCAGKWKSAGAMVKSPLA